jgi:hypothetical protein
MYRKPTAKEQAAAWHSLAFHINLHRTITMNHEAVVAALKRMDAYVAAHGTQNGERSADAIEANVRRAFWEQIAQDPEAGKKPARAEKS